MFGADKTLALRGMNYQVNEFITVKHPTLSEIFDYGEDNYYASIQPFVCKPEDLMVEYDDAGIDYATLDNYSVFLDLYQVYKHQNFDFTWLLGFDLCSKDIAIIQNDTNDEYDIIRISDGQLIINRLIYQQISDFLRLINNIDSKPKYNPGNEFTKKFLIIEQRAKREREQKKQKKDSELSKIINAVAWKNSGINILNIWQLHIYQLFTGIQAINKIDHVKSLLQGVYNGVIDSKKINSDEFNWIT